MPTQKKYELEKMKFILAFVIALITGGIAYGSQRTDVNNLKTSVAEIRKEISAFKKEYKQDKKESRQEAREDKKQILLAIASIEKK